MALNFPSDTSSPYTDPSSGIKYIYNTAVGAWESAIQPPAIVSGTTPSTALDGFFWWDSANQDLYVFQSGTWRPAGGAGAGGTSVSVSSTPPVSPGQGDLWWDDVSGELFIYYSDADSAQWMAASPQTAGGNGGAVFSGPTAPGTPIEGDLWYNTTTSVLSVYTGSVWNAVESSVTGVLTVTGSAPVNITGTATDPVVNVTAASTSATGVVRLATQAETDAATLTSVALTPGALANGIDNYLPVATDTQSGIVELATQAETETGTDITKAVTPAALSNALPNMGVGNPAGTVITFAGSSAPTGYLACDGALVSRTTYADLFAAVGTVYGIGDGSTTFQLPDLRGEFIRGWDDGRGIDSGRAFGSTQNSANKAHTHDVTAPSTSTSGSTPGWYAGDGTGSETVASASQGETEARPRNIALLYCIKH
ncbi:tail fiber protein [Synechococcus phage S-B68]|nr:tail fiber protein [Synechococcus phage S-B68]